MTLVKKTNGFYPTFNNLLDDFWGTNWLAPVRQYETTIPAVNVKEENNSYKIEVAAPGYTKSDFTVSLKNEILTISVTKNEEKNEESDNFKRKEFSYSSFIRKFEVPNNLVDSDNVKANYENGILSISIPKKEEIKQSRMIEIN